MLDAAGLEATGRVFKDSYELQCKLYSKDSNYDNESTELALLLVSSSFTWCWASMTVGHIGEQRRSLTRPHHSVDVYAVLHGFAEPLPTVVTVCRRGFCLHQPSHETACMPLTLCSAAVLRERRVHI